MPPCVTQTLLSPDPGAVQGTESPIPRRPPLCPAVRREIPDCPYGSLQAARTFAEASRTPPPGIVDLRGIAKPAAHAVTLRGTSKAGSESATNTSDVLSDTPMTRSAKGSGGDAFPGVIDSTSDVGPDSNDDPDSTGDDAFSLHLGNTFDDDDDEAPVGDAGEHALSINAISGDFGELGADLSPWAPLLGMLDSTEPEASPGDRPFTPTEGVEGAHALELRAESMLQYSERGAERTGELDRTEVGVSDDNRDVVAGRDQVEIDGMLDEHTGHGLVHVADEVELNVGGPLRMHAHLEDNIIMGGVMRDEWSGGTFITAAMSDDMAAGLGLRCTAPLDLWVHGLVGMEERPGTCAADGILLELAGTLYEREYGPSVHGALVARHSGTVVTTMKTGFRPLMKTALGVRNLIPGGGGGGGGDASVSPPAAPPAPGGGEAAGAVTLTAAESGGALGRGVAGSDDTDEIVSVVRTVETASDTAEVENLQHPAGTADNLDDLARVEAEGTGYRQVAEIYEQPIPAAAASEPDAAPVPGRGPAAADRTPPLDLTEPGTEGYDFRKSYGSLRERNHFYRLDANWRGNFVMRDLLDTIDSRAIALFEEVGGSLDDVTGDYRTRTSAIHTALEAMAEQPEIAANAERLADIRGAIDELEGLVQGRLAEVAARTDEFAGTALGSQRVPIDRHIDTDMLRNWFQEQLQQAQDKFAWALTIDDPNAEVPLHQLAGWEAEYYGQMIQSLDKGVNPLADSSEQVAFLNKKVEDYENGFKGAAAAHLAETGEELVIPVLPEKYELDLLRDLQKQLFMTLSEPEYIRSIEEMGADTFAPLVRTRIDEGLDFLGPDSLRPLADGVDEPDVNPVLGADVPPPTPPLDLTPPGTEGYAFRNAYYSLQDRNLFYRDEFNFRGNFFLREYLREIDTKAMKLFQGLDGPADAIDGDNFGYRTSSIYRTLEQMAEDAETANELNRAADLRAGMAEIESMVNSTLAEVAVRTDEFSGAAPGSPRSHIDPNIDTEKLRSWLQDQAQQAHDRFLVAETDEAGQLATWEWGYYVQLIQSLDEGVNPLAVSNEQIVVTQINTGKPTRTPVADDVASAAAEGHGLASPRPQLGDEADLYARLQDLLITTLSDPEFHRSAEEMGAGAFTFPVRARIDEGLDFLGPDSLRPLGAGDIPPPLPAADFAESAGYIDEVRDRSFSRSALAASEETLERQAAGFAEGDASVRSRAPVPDSGAAEPSLGSRRAPPDSAEAPTIDERSGRWVVDPPEPVDSPASSDDASSTTTDVSWESGLQVSDDSEIDYGDVDPWEFFSAASEPEDADLEGVDDVQHAPATNDDGSSGSTTARAVATGGEDANPTGTLSRPDDSSTASRRGIGPGPDPSGTPSSITPGTPDPVSTGTPRNARVTDATPAGASASDAVAGAAGTRSDLYNEPVSFEGRSLEGTPLSDDSKELAQSLDGAEIPVEDLPPVEPGPAGPRRKSILKHAGDMPDPGLSYVDEDEAITDRRIEYARNTRGRSDRNADTVWRRARNRKEAVDAANARWSEFAAAKRTSSTSFSDDPRQVLYLVEHETTLYSNTGEKIADVYRGVDPPNTLDRSHAAHFISRPRGWEPAHETGFGRLSQGWNEFPFSHRERILNTLSKGESLNPEQIAALESGLEGYRAAGGSLSSSQHRAMVDMISDLSDQYRHARWSMEGERGKRLVQLIEMLDYAAMVV